jgi:DNA-binding SARP family transcriptional activator/predicted ATPase
MRRFAARLPLAAPEGGGTIAHLAVRLLGPLQVTLDGEPITGLESDKVRALLAYLAVEREHPHRREKLAGLLWPELPEQSARTNLRVALSNLRHCIGDQKASPPFLDITRQTIQLCAGNHTWVDAVEIARLLAARGRPQRVARCLEEATKLYRGPFLEGFSLPDSPAFEEWALVERERLGRRVVAALHHLARWHESHAEYRQALHYARRQVEFEPWQEGGQRQAMRLLALTGQRNAALVHYETLRQTLAEELGVAPEDETTALYQRIRSGKDLGPATTTPPHNLPAELTPFVGREKELEELYDRLRDPGCRLLSLIGPGGSGKTRLALKAAEDLLSDGGSGPRDGVFFISLAPLRSAEALVPTVAKALGFTFNGGHEPGQQLLGYLHKKQMLLILDNFEHLLPGPEEIAENSGRTSTVRWVVDLLKVAPHVRILVTSRARLKLQAEHSFPLGGMALPREEDLIRSERTDELLGYDGVELFFSGARRARPDFRLSPDNGAHVVRICRLVGAMPLAILLAAAWVENLAPAEIATAIVQGLDFLGSGWQDLPARQRSMRAVFDHSWRLLARREQKVLLGLSVFRGSFTRRAAHQVTGALTRDLGALAHRSLLDQTPGGRYGMHELLRQYAAEKLGQSPRTREKIHDRHSDWFTSALETWGADLKGPHQQATLAAMQAEAENARGAWEWTVERGQPERLDRALEGLCLFYEWQVRYREGAAACRLAAERLAGLVAPSNSELCLLARVLVWQSVFVHRFDGEETSRQLLARSLALLDSPRLSGHDTRLERAQVLWRMGRSKVGSDRNEARRLFEQALALYQAVGDRWGMANTLASLGGVAWNLGDYQEARRWHEESLAIRQSLGDQRGIAASLMAVGSTALSQGRLDDAEQLVRKGCALHQEIGDQRGIADGLRHLGVALLALGKLAEASSLLKRCVAIYTDLGFQFGLEVAMLGDAQAHLGNYDAAQRHGEEGLAIARRTGYRRGIGYSLFVLGEVALAAGKYGEAAKLLEESVAVYQEIGQWDECCRSLAALACASRALGRHHRVRQELFHEMRRAADRQALAPLVWGLPALALLLADRGEQEQATELHALARHYPLVAQSRWFEDVVGRPIKALASTPPTDVMASARERDQVQDLQAALMKVLSGLGG